MDSLPSPYYLPSPYSKGLGIFSPDKEKSASKFSFASFTEQKASRFSLDNPSLNQTSDKVITHMQTTSKRMLDKMHEINHNIANNNLPFIKYCQPGTETFKSKKEISHAIKTSHDFFQADNSLFQGSKYRPKDLFFSPGRKNITLFSPQRRIPNDTSKFQFEELEENKEIQPALIPMSPKQIKLLHPKETSANLQKKMTLQDEDEAKTSPNISSTQYTSLDTAPSIFQMNSGEKVLRETEEMVLVNYNKGKIPLNLYESTIKRKNLIKEIREGRSTALSNSKHIEKQASIVIKKEDLKQSAIPQSIVPKELANTESQDKEKKRRKFEMTTRSPVNNVYYQIIGMSSPRKKFITNKLKVMTPKEQSRENSVNPKDQKNTKV